MPAGPDELPRTEPVGEGDHVVGHGESMASIAGSTGHFWPTIWQHPANAKLRAAREDPEVLLPGDRVTVPPIRPKDVSCATAKRHVFRRRGVPVKVAYVVRDPLGKAFSGKKYRLEVEGAVFEGATDARGKIEHWVAPQAKLGRLRVWLAEPGLPAELDWEIRIGYVNPHDSVSGMKARLNNLGFSCGEEDDEIDDRFLTALRAFQRHHGLPPSGQIDAATRDLLRREHVPA
jgi:hypothetical protein